MPLGDKESVRRTSDPPAPSLKKLEQLVEQAKADGKKAQLEWINIEERKTYRLLLRLQGDERTWSLKQVDGPEAKEVWKSETSDLETVMAACRTPGETPQYTGAGAEPAFTSVISPDFSRANPGARDFIRNNFQHYPNMTEELEALGETGSVALSLLSQLTNAQTGFLESSAILNVLDAEFQRFREFGTPLSLILFHIESKEPLTLAALTAAAMRTDLVAGNRSICGHFDDQYKAIIMPATTAPLALLAAARVYEALLAAPLAPGFHRGSLRISMGISNLPEHGTGIEALVTLARNSEKRARQGSYPFALASSE